MRACRFESRQRFVETNLGVQDVHRIQPEPLFTNLLPMPHSARNFMAIIAHAVASWTSGAGFARMSEGVQV